MVNHLAIKPPSRKKIASNTDKGINSATKSNVKVVVRVRPRNAIECLGNHRNVVQVMDERVIVFDPNDDINADTFLPNIKRARRSSIMDRRVKDLKFIFDRVFDEKSTNQDIFDHTTKIIIEGVLNGYNCTVFAYGATGAGKTHTMLGNGDTPGVMFLTMMELYSRIEEMKEQQKTCEVAVSYLEVYNETIRDLLMPGKPLAVREDPQRGVCVNGLTLHQPRSAEELFEMLEFGNRNRSQHPTDANATSSRSHAVFQVFVRQKNERSGLKTDIQVGKMSLIDLAGSERATATKNRGARFREGANINKSLLALGNCINALAENQGKKLHVPYRNSKLTRILKDSLGGNCRTVMIATVSPSNLSYEDTYNTLKYADRAKSIKSNLMKNIVSVDVHVSRYANLAKELQDEVSRLKTKLNRFESGEATPMKRNLGQTRKNEAMEKLQCDIKTVYDERSVIKKNLVDTECLEKELMEKLQRKQKNVEWMNLLSQDENKTFKVETRVRKCLSATKARMNHLKERRDKLEGQLHQNDEWLQRTHNEVKMFDINDDAAAPLFLTVYESSCCNELKHNEVQQQCKYYEKCLKNYESQRKREKRLIDALLKFARKQFAVLKSSGMTTNEINEDYENIISIVEDNREVAWADQSSQPMKSTDPDDLIKMVDANLSSISTSNVTPGRTPRKPILSTNLTPRRVKTPTLVLSSTLALNKDLVSPFVPRINIPSSVVSKTSSECPVRQNLLGALNETGTTGSTTSTAVDLSSLKSDVIISSGTPLNPFTAPRGLEPKDGQAIGKETSFNTTRPTFQADRGGMTTTSFTKRFQPKLSAKNYINKSLPLREHNGLLSNRPPFNDQSTMDTTVPRIKTNTTLGGDIGKKTPSYASLTKSAAQKITSRDMLPKRSHSKENAHPQPKRRKLPRTLSSCSTLSMADQSRNGEKHMNHVSQLKRAVSMLHIRK